MTRYRIVEYKNGKGTSTYYGQRYLCFGIWKKIRDRGGYKIDEVKYSYALDKINVLIQDRIRSKKIKHKVYTKMCPSVPDHIPDQQREEYLKTFGEGKKYEE